MRSAGFEGKTAVVTGAGSGIGRALATELVRKGAHVVLADLDGDAATRAASELAGSSGGSATGRALDVRDAEATRVIVDEVVDRHGAIDFWFANAGTSLGGPTHEFEASHWERVLDVNLGGVVNGLLAAYPLMVERGAGHFVATASAAGLVPPPFVLPYATAKHGVVGLCTGLRPEAALHGVRVSVICPGSVETPILDRLPDADLPPRATEPVTARTYLALIGQKPMPADRFARRALAQVARNRSIVIVPNAVKSLWYLHRMSPRVAERISGLIARRVDRKLLRPPQ